MILTATTLSLSQSYAATKLTPRENAKNFATRLIHVAMIPTLMDPIARNGRTRMSASGYTIPSTVVTASSRMTLTAMTLSLNP